MILLASAALSAALDGPARAANDAWTTYLKAYTYTDLIVDSSSVWCATLEGGLRRFDRTRHVFEQIAREPGGIASNQLTALALDRSRRLWVGTAGAGLSYLSADRTRWNLLNQFDGLPSDTVNALAAEGDTLWIGTSAGLSLWDGTEVIGTLPDGVNPSPFASNDITGIAVIGDSVLVSNLGGVYLSHLSDDLTTWTQVGQGLPSARVERLATDGRNVLAFSTDTSWKAPYALTAGVWSMAPPPSNVIRTIEGENGVIFANATAGMFTWDGAHYTRVAGAPGSAVLPASWVHAARAPDGVIYGGRDLGFFEQTPGGAAWNVYHAPEPPGNDITNVALDGDRVYVETFTEGIGRFANGTWKNWRPGDCTLPNCDPDTAFANAAFAFALLVDRRGIKWFSCWGSTAQPIQSPGAIELLDDHGSVPQFQRFQNGAWGDGLVPVRHTFAVGATLDSAGGHWFGLDSPERENAAFAPIGIDYYDSTGAFVRNINPSTSELRTGRILALATDRAGFIWVGTTGGGVQRFAPGPDGTATFEDQPPSVTVDVRGIAVAGDTVWAQSTNDVSSYNSITGGLRTVSSVPAPPFDNAGHPLEVASDGSIWAGTTDGIRVYERDGKTRMDLTQDNSPLASNDVHAIRLDPRTGLLWIGTAAGLQSYDPHYVAPPPPAVPQLHALVYPNPARITAIGAALRITGNTSDYRGDVFALDGRHVRRFEHVDNGELVWDGRDDGGRLVPPGIYFMHVSAGGRSAVVRFVMLH